MQFCVFNEKVPLDNPCGYDTLSYHLRGGEGMDFYGGEGRGGIFMEERGREGRGRDFF
jgi:hypothetical protein